MYIGQWGMDYWDPNSNAEAFTSNPDNSDDASTKTLAWRNAWDIPELTKQTQAALLERDNDKRAEQYKKLQQEASTRACSLCCSSRLKLPALAVT